MTRDASKHTRRGFWTVAAFYLLIVFEFFYMASPFAAYFYSVYRPSLNFLNDLPGISWLVQFFLPHIVVNTSSAAIDSAHVVGSVVTVLGLIAFLIGAAQVYYHKLRKKGVVLGGVYRFIRHPQYAALAWSGFGLLLLWPRYLVLVFFVSMLFVYYLLARVEERECEETFGQSYREYQRRTGMFLPFRLPLVHRLATWPMSRLRRILVGLLLYAVVLLGSIGVARGVQWYAVHSLHGTFTRDHATIAVTEVRPTKLRRLLEIALADVRVASRLNSAGWGRSAKFINYVLPAAWVVTEIPMHIPADKATHHTPAQYDRNRYRIIFTKAWLPGHGDAQMREILMHARGRRPVVEVVIDPQQNRVVQVLDPPEKEFYENVPVPIY